MIASKFYYSEGGDPEVWTEEPNLQSFVYEEPILKPRSLRVVVADPKNQRQPIYSALRRVKLVERESEKPIFIGRVEVCEPNFSNELGQTLEITALDYMSDLTRRNLDSDYSSYIYASDVTAQIITDYVFSGNISTDGIENSAVAFEKGLDFRKLNKSSLEGIFRLASADKWDAAPSGYGYDYYLGNNQIFYYQKRGKYIGVNAETEAGYQGGSNPALYGLTIALEEQAGDQKRLIFGDYAFAREHPKELVTRVVVHYFKAIFDEEGNQTGREARTVTKINPEVENALHIISEKHIRLDEEITDIGAEDRAAAYLKQYSHSEAIPKGKCKISGYPQFIYEGVRYFVRASHLVYIHCSNVPLVDETDMLVTKIVYREPECISELELLAKDEAFEDVRFSIGDYLVENERKLGVGFQQQPSFSQYSIAPNILWQACQPYVCDIEFPSANQDWNSVSWQAGTITFADKTTLSIEAGNLELPSPHPYFLYFITGNHSLRSTQDFGETLAGNKGLVAMVQQGPATDQKALILPAKGKSPLLNALVLCANLILAEHIRAGEIVIGGMDGKVTDHRQRLLIYYGTPKGVKPNGQGDGLWDDDLAGSFFAQWDYIVFGSGLEDPGNEFHQSTINIISKIHSDNIMAEVFGYIPLGLVTEGSATFTQGSDQVVGSGTHWLAWGESYMVGKSIKSVNDDSAWYKITAVADDTHLTIETNYAEAGGEGHSYIIEYTETQLKAKIDQWAAMGVNGVLLDEAGWDYEVTRARLNEIVDHCHEKSRKALVNAWEPDDVMGNEYNEQYNPNQTPTKMDYRDYYLSESFLVNTGAYTNNYMTPYMFKTKHDKLVAYRKSLRVKMLGIGVVEFNLFSDAETEHFFRMVEAGACIYCLDGYGVSAYRYSAAAPLSDVAYAFSWWKDYYRFYTLDANYQLDAAWREFKKLDMGITLHITGYWVANKEYTAEYDWVVPTDYEGLSYECTTGGTSGATEPTWPTDPGETVTDGTVVWTCRAVKTFWCEREPNSEWILKDLDKLPDGDAY